MLSHPSWNHNQIACSIWPLAASSLVTSLLEAKNFFSSSIFTLSLTVALLLFVLVVVWRCWNAPPVPIRRLWALGFGYMSAAMLTQMWRAELWKKRYFDLEQSIHAPKSQSRSRTSVWPQSKSTSRFCTTLYGADWPSCLELSALIDQYDSHTELLTEDSLGEATGRTNNIRKSLAHHRTDFSHHSLAWQRGQLLLGRFLLAHQRQLLGRIRGLRMGDRSSDTLSRLGLLHVRNQDRAWS